ncbi:MAG: alginate lyase family protein, partial [bacterium]
TTALAAQAHGQDWFRWTNARGASLETALEWLAPFAEGKETHLEYVHSTVPFDAQRRAAGVKGFSGAWDPETGGLLYGIASRLDGRWTDLAEKLGGTPAWMDCLLPPGKPRDEFTV